MSNIQPKFHYHDLTHNPVSLWQLNGDLTDESGNGYTLSLNAGTEKYTEITPGLTGIHLDGSTILSTTGANLIITGDITLECLIFTHSISSSPALIQFSASGETEPTNILYSLRILSDGRFKYFAEYNAGVNIEHTAVNTSPQYSVAHVAMVREDDDVTFYVNGRQLEASSSGLNTPSGGGSGDLKIGTDGGSANFNGILASAKIIPSALTATQVLAEAKHCLPYNI